jgi:predicted DNA binding CopG/RHH family protein
MNKKEKIIAELSKELTGKKDTRINIRMSDDLYQKILKHKDESGVSISNIIRIALMNYFVENEVND